MSSQSKGNDRVSWRLTVSGRVQGVGFRPSVYRAARAAGVCGYVANSAGGAVIEVEGTPRKVKSFFDRLASFLPPHASISRLSKERQPLKGYRGFAITESRKSRAVSAEFPSDMSICPDCHKELFDPRDRRYLYPFINCTNCGPRFSIVRELPYDRPKTTMRGFALCPECGREYRDPSDRRFHAQPNACPACGPSLQLTRSRTVIAIGNKSLPIASGLLKKVRILAVKGLGGYHLSCDASNAGSIRRLRKRKDRPHKPLALMLPDVDEIRRICVVSAYEEELLTSAARPIVLLRKRNNISETLPTAELLAPGNAYLGVMLPYTPLHYLLFDMPQSSTPRMLVMTSGNRRDEPICRSEEDAFERLNGIADNFLVHDRPIHNRCDDSIIQAIPGLRESVFIRRSRGFVPDPVPFVADTGSGERKRIPRTIFASGAELKNTFCLTRGTQAYLSPHIGEMDNRESLEFYAEALQRYKRFLAVRPAMIAHDLHPDYRSTAFAVDFGKRQRIYNRIPVQHHTAHMGAVIAEKGIKGPAVGFSFDGTGYGDDGAIWGSECFVYDGRSFKRAAHFAYFRLAGGDAATTDIWRIAVALLHHAHCDTIPLEVTRNHPVKTVRSMIENGFNSPWCCSAGRLFDGVAALMGIRERVTFEAQAAIEMETMATELAGNSLTAGKRLDKIFNKVYNFNIIPENGDRKIEERAPHGLVITLEDMIREICRDRRLNVPPAIISGRFHRTLADMIVQLSLRFRSSDGAGDVLLGGGVFQNRLLLLLTRQLLEAEGFRVHHNSLVPPNDGGIALGQAWCAAKGIR